MTGLAGYQQTTPNTNFNIGLTNPITPQVQPLDISLANSRTGPYNSNTIGSSDPMNLQAGRVAETIQPQGMSLVNGDFSGTNSYDPSLDAQFGNNYSTGDLDYGTGNDGGFDFSGAMKNFSLGAQGITGLASAYTAWRQTRLMKEQLAMQKGIANRNIESSAKAYNAQSLARARVAAQLYGNPVGTEGYDQKVAEIHDPVNGAPIGS